MERERANSMACYDSDRVTALVKCVGFFQRCPSEQNREFCAIAFSVGPERSIADSAPRRMLASL
jgi:hypothetical protein